MSVEIYLGNPPENIKKWIKENYKSKKNVPLHFTAENPDDNITIQIHFMDGEFVWSNDEMKTWKILGKNADGRSYTLYLNSAENNTIYIKARYGDVEENPNLTCGSLGRFNINGGLVKAGGNIQFLLTDDGLRTDAPENCYASMFNSCSSLTQAPELPATELADECYYCMFWLCKSPFTFSDKTFVEVANLIQDQYLIGDYWYYYDEEYNEVIINPIEIICSDKTMLATYNMDEYTWTLTEK